MAATVDEDSVRHPDPRKNVVETAHLKARAIAGQFPDAIIIAADTTVAIDGQMLGKPADVDEATKTIRRLRGREHQVYTGMVLCHTRSERLKTAVCSTSVVMRAYSDEEIERYVRSGDPFDKAGAYAIQHAGFSPVARIRGCYTNVVGLALCDLCVILRCFGVNADLSVAEQSADYRHCATCLDLTAGQTL